MGYELLSARVSGRVSRHNSEQDGRDITRWNEVVEKLRALEAEYDDIDLMVSAYAVEVPTYGS